MTAWVAVAHRERALAELAARCEELGWDPPQAWQDWQQAVLDESNIEAVAVWMEAATPGSEGLTFAELDAYGRLTGRAPDPETVYRVRLIDRTVRAHHNRSSQRAQGTRPAAAPLRTRPRGHPRTTRRQR